MLNIRHKLFNTAIVTLLIAAPVLAANGGTAGGGSVDGHTIAQKKLGDCAGGACERGGKMGFSDSQLEKMSSLKNQFLDKTASGRTEIETLHRQLREVLSQPTIDRAKAEGIQNKINSIKADMSNARLNLRIDEIAVLTPEQREAMRHRMLVSEAFGGGRFGHHRHGGGGHFGGGGRHFEHGGGPKQHPEKA
jgi:Spy/CpxP family protein refolding chaperone